MAPANPSSTGDKPLSGLSLYAGISLSGQAAAEGSAPPGSRPSQEGKVITPADTPAASTPASTPSGTPSTASGWSAALRFAPRKSGSNSSTGGGKAKAKQRPSAASLAFASSAALTDAQDGQDHQGEAVTPLQKPAPTQVRNVHGNAPRSSSTAKFSSSPWSQSVVAAKSAESTSPIPKDTVATSTLVAPSTSTSVSKYVLPVIMAPPELRLDQDELDKDKHLARQAAIARGEAKQAPQQRSWGGEDDEYDDEGGDTYKQEGWTKGSAAEEDEDVNGFRQSEAGAKANKKRKYKRKRGNSPSGPAPTNWAADYDPRVPNDYIAWKEIVQKERAAAVKDENERRWEEEQDDGARYRGFAPPSSYGRPPPPEQEEEEEKLYISPPPPSPPPHVAQAPPGPPPSAPPPPSTSGEEAYQRRVALSRQMQSETGEEAYQRRLAMSQQQQPTPGTQSAPASAPYNAPPLARGDDPAPSDMEASRNAAAAIAARLSQKSSLAVAENISIPSDDNPEHRPDPAAFAERLMAKWGHTQGQGLGAEGNQGRSEALLMEKVKQDRTHHRHQDHNARSATAARGKFNTSDDPRTQADLEKYGKSSEVIYLSNVLSPGDEVDPDLPEDIASECNKYGIVQRVALHPPSGGCFVRFSGPAGAWKAVRELDGRFFAGSKIQARYFDREAFDRGDLNGRV